MIVYMSQLSNLQVTLDLETGNVVATYGMSEPIADTVVPVDTYHAVMVRAARSWIGDNGWFDRLGESPIRPYSEPLP